MVITMVPIVSRTVKAIGYNGEEKTMLVEFNSGTQYKYFDVSKEEYLSVINDASVGSKLRKVMGSKEYKKL